MADEVRASCRASRSEVEASTEDALPGVVVLANTKRLISFFKNRGLSTSSRCCCCAGAAAAKHVAESSVDSSAREAASIIVDLRNMMEMECDGRVGLYYLNRMEMYILSTPSTSSDVTSGGERQALTVRIEYKRVNLTSQD